MLQRPDFLLCGFATIQDTVFLQGVIKKIVMIFHICTFFCRKHPGGGGH
jgi:hypothetical protein